MARNGPAPAGHAAGPTGRRRPRPWTTRPRHEGRPGSQGRGFGGAELWGDGLRDGRGASFRGTCSGAVVFGRAVGVVGCGWGGCGRSVRGVRGGVAVVGTGFRGRAVVGWWAVRWVGRRGRRRCVTGRRGSAGEAPLSCRQCFGGARRWGLRVARRRGPARIYGARGAGGGRLRVVGPCGLSTGTPGPGPRPGGGPWAPTQRGGAPRAAGGAACAGTA